MRSVLYIVRAMGNTLLVVAVGHFLDNTLLVVLTNGECEIPTTYTYFGEFLIRVCKMRAVTLLPIRKRYSNIIVTNLLS